MCTGIRFNDSNGNMFFGRNLDWSRGYGEKIVITPKAWTYSSAFAGEMTPKYAVIGMAIIEEGVPLYFDCGNDAGLAIAGLNFPGYAKYEDDVIEGMTNIAAYEFPLWVAMNHSSVDELEEALRKVSIIAKPINEKYPVSMLHWIIGDKSRSIVVEYTESGMQIFHNDADVLTNQPGYEWHRENLRNYINLSSAHPETIQWGKSKLSAFGSGALMRGLPGDYYSPSRFVRVAYLNANYPAKASEEENVSRLFHTLAGVAMIDGAAVMGDGDFEKTIYTGGYSAATKTYYWNSYDDPSIKHVSLADIDTGSSCLISPQDS